MRNHGQKFGLFIDNVAGNAAPVRDQHGRPRIFASERKAQEALARIGIAKLRAFLRAEMDFDDALAVVKEYYEPVEVAADGSVRIIPFEPLFDDAQDDRPGKIQAIS